MGKALVLGSGGLRGGYDAGVAATLCRQLGRDYFDSIYVSSVGAYAGTFYAAGQPDIIETVRREHSHGSLLIKPLNILKGKSVLDLDYMLGLFKTWPFRLETESILAYPGKLTYVVTSYDAGEPKYLTPKSDEEVFLFMRASAAIPMFHPPVAIEGKNFFDGAMTDPLPVEKALADGHEEVVVVCNRPSLKIGRLDRVMMCAISLTYRGDLKQLKKNYYDSWRRVDNALKDHRVRIISPTTNLSFRWHLDSSKKHLNEAVDLGVRDALAFLT